MVPAEMRETGRPERTIQRQPAGHERCPRGRSAEPIRIGTAGWANPPFCRASRPLQRSHLQHYAAHFNCVEINSSFYRSHRPGTYARWCAQTPDDFRFAVKLPRTFSHGSQLGAQPQLLERFLDEVNGLGRKLAVLLLQMPPSRLFDAEAADRFFSAVLRRAHCPLVCEPRHVSWFAADGRALLSAYGIGLVAADPPCSPEEQLPSGKLRYFRLHGSPRMYYSPYSGEYLAAMAARANTEVKGGRDVWCVFDNTAAHAAWDDARKLNRLLGRDETAEGGVALPWRHS